MSFRFGIKTLAAGLTVATTLAGCSDIYTARRESISVTSGDAIASNRVTQMIDPWSPASGNRSVASNGERVQAAAERYRTGRVIAPVNATTSSASYSQLPQQGQPSPTPQSGSSGGSSK